MQTSFTKHFELIPVDKATAVTVKNAKTPGEATRFSLKSGAGKRYYIIADHRTSFLGLMRDKVSEHFKKSICIMYMVSCRLHAFRRMRMLHFQSQTFFKLE